MPVMTSPGERRLDRPPSERYRTPPEPESVVAGSTARAVMAGLAAGAGWVVATIVLGGVLALSAGLLVIAAGAGRLIGLAIGWGAGLAVAPGPRLGLMVGVVVVAFVLGQLGLWAYARLEGGVLAPIDYLGATFGLIAPLQLILAGAVGWWTAR